MKKPGEVFKKWMICTFKNIRGYRYVQFDHVDLRDAFDRGRKYEKDKQKSIAYTPVFETSNNPNAWTGYACGKPLDPTKSQHPSS